MDRISGLLSVTNEVTLLGDDGSTYNVIVFPLQAAIGWEMIVARSVEVFRNDHGLHVTLEGNLHGTTLASARRVSDVSARPGMFRGRVESASGTQLDVELRVEDASRVVSADFFRNGTFYCSMRARVATTQGVSVATSPRFIFDMQSESNIGGRLEYTARSAQVVEMTCIIPEAFPDEYRGELASVSDFYRILNIEVDKLDGLPWPPEYSTRDIPAGEQPADLAEQTIGLTALFRQSGIDARVHHNDGALDATIGQQTGRPGEEDRWDEREMHEMMDTHYSRNLSDREWWLYLLIVTRFDGGPSYNAQDGSFNFDAAGNILNDGVGTTGIIFDHSAGNIRDPWTPFFEWFSVNRPQFRHLFDFGRTGSFANSRARQGAAVFWREMLDFVALDEQWYRDRQFLRTIVHELGHALNLAHAWLVGRPDTTSFMMYPQRYPHGSTYGERVRNYWRDFNYLFDPEEVFHFRHGFYHEIIPGGRLEFMQWTPSSVFRDPTAGGTRANIALDIKATKDRFRFTEPVTVEVSIKNHSAQEQPIGRLSPSYGDTKFIIRKPNGAIDEYRPPLLKCEWTKQTLDASSIRKHVTSLAVGHNGFVFDAPGRYEVTASIPDPSSGVLVIAKPVSIWINYPTRDDEDVASRVFNRESALFLYLGGGEHLSSGRDGLADAMERHPEHPFSAHANLVLGLNELAGQKSVVQGQVKSSKPKEALPFLKQALQAAVFAPLSQERLKSTIALCEPEEQSTKKRRPRKRSTK
ncbi:MAG: hypothetical protein KDK04_06940 [Candidatus Competibacteraceae bacterium]|nr:hypothetical protein [Candidatus Competibacteraceae bacterium]